RVPDLTLTFNTHPNPEVTPQGQLARAMAHVRKRGYDFVSFTSWVPYADRGAFYDQFACALLTFPQSLETDLSMRTRVYDYLWGGLPIISCAAPGTAEILAKYDAGLTSGCSAAALSHTLIDVLTNRSRYDALVRGTQRFVTEH